VDQIIKSLYINKPSAVLSGVKRPFFTEKAVAQIYNFIALQILIDLCRIADNYHLLTLGFTLQILYLGLAFQD